MLNIGNLDVTEDNRGVQRQPDNLPMIKLVSQSSHGLDRLQTSQLTEMFVRKFGANNNFRCNFFVIRYRQLD